MPHRAILRCPLTLAFTIVIVAGASAAGHAQSTAPAADTAGLTTMSGVFTSDQAAKGKDVYMLACVSCHTPPDHTGGSFWSDLVGKKVSRFFSYLREEMPQDNPGSISDDDYINVMSYILRLNAMPTGVNPLLPDTVALAKIRFVLPDSTKKGP